jgi:hypothetical protein
MSQTKTDKQLAKAAALERERKAAIVQENKNREWRSNPLPDDKIAHFTIGSTYYLNKDATGDRYDKVWVDVNVFEWISNDDGKPKFRVKYEQRSCTWVFMNISLLKSKIYDFNRIKSGADEFARLTTALAKKAVQ